MPKANKVRNVSAHGVRLAENRCSANESLRFIYLISVG